MTDADFLLLIAHLRDEWNALEDEDREPFLSKLWAAVNG